MAMRTTRRLDRSVLRGPGPRRELIDGALVVIPDPTLRHQAVLSRMRRALESAGAAPRAGDELELSRHDVVRPDLVTGEGEVLLVVEVLSDPHTDRVLKRACYARHGIPEYWVVDPEADRIEVHRLRGRLYGKPELHEPGERVAPSALPQGRIDLGWLFRR